MFDCRVLLCPRWLSQCRWIRTQPPCLYLIVVFCVLLCPQIRARLVDHCLCPGVLRFRQCLLVNGLLLYVFISADLGRAAGSSSLSRRSQIWASPLSNSLLSYFFDFFESRHNHRIIVFVPAFTDSGIAPWWIVYCCIFVFPNWKDKYMMEAYHATYG